MLLIFVGWGASSCTSLPLRAGASEASYKGARAIRIVVEAGVPREIALRASSRSRLSANVDAKSPMAGTQCEWSRQFSWNFKIPAGRTFGRILSLVDPDNPLASTAGILPRRTTKTINQLHCRSDEPSVINFPQDVIIDGCRSE